jgi:hypothetical protein
MKTKVLMTLAAMTVTLLMTGRASVYAQVTEPDLEANVPFKFMVGDTSLPAGKYTIKRLDDEDQNVLEIRSADDRIAVAFLTESAQSDRTPTKSELVFDKYGNQYFLSQIWTEGDMNGNQLAKPRAELKLEKSGGAAERDSVAYHRVSHNAKESRRSSART